MTFETLLSTMRRKDYNIIKENNITTTAVVINQTNEDSRTDIKIEGKEVKWINSTELGLSKSRNLAIKNSQADLLLISDDDVIYRDNYEKIIIDFFHRNPSADVVAFKVLSIEEQKTIGLSVEKERKIRFRKAMQISSVQIVIRREAVLSKNIKYDENFGPGGLYNMGDENIFLSRCYRKKLNFFASPEIIADVHTEESVWFSGFTNKYFFDRGAILTGISKTFSLLYILRFSILKHKIYKKDSTWKNALSQMIKGRKHFLSSGENNV